MALVACSVNVCQDGRVVLGASFRYWSERVWFRIPFLTNLISFWTEIYFLCSPMHAKLLISFLLFYYFLGGIEFA